jgi:hypothetical protein
VQLKSELWVQTGSSLLPTLLVKFVKLSSEVTTFEKRKLFKWMNGFGIPCVLYPATDRGNCLKRELPEEGIAWRGNCLKRELPENELILEGVQLHALKIPSGGSPLTIQLLPNTSDNGTHS